MRNGLLDIPKTILGSIIKIIGWLFGFVLKFFAFLTGLAGMRGLSGSLRDFGDKVGGESYTGNSRGISKLAGGVIAAPVVIPAVAVSKTVHSIESLSDKLKNALK